MPSGFYMSLDPFFDRGDVVGRVFEVVSDGGGLGRRDKGGRWGVPRLRLDGPAAVLDTSREMIGATVGLGIGKIEVLCRGRGIVGEEAIKVSKCSLELYNKRVTRMLTDACL